jgi:hypothetical protein
MKYWQRKKQERLYRQWAEHAGLPSEVVPSPEIPVDIKMGVGEESWFYRLRVWIVDMVKMILRVE